MALVPPVLHVLARVIVRPPLAPVVNRLAVGEQRPAVAVDGRPAAERHVVDDHRRQVLGVGRAGRQVDQVLEARHRVGDAQRAGGVGRRCREASVCRAGTKRDGGGRTVAHLPGDLQRRPASNRAIRPVRTGRDRALHHDDVLAPLLLHDQRPCLLGPVPGRRHDRLVIVDRERVQDDVGHRRPCRPQKRLGITGTVLKLEPNQARLLVGLYGLSDLPAQGLGHGENRGHHAAEAEELPARDPPPFQLLDKPALRFGHLTPPG